MCVCVPATCVLIVLLERCLGVSGGIFWPSPCKWGRICSLGLFRRAPFPQYSYLAHDTWVESPWLSVSVHREPVFSPPAFISSVLADYPSPVLTFSLTSLPSLLRCNPRARIPLLHSHQAVLPTRPTPLFFLHC